MTGAAIVRREAQGTIVLAVHGAFDGASAWALRVAMEESSAIRFVIDLTYADEAFEFAACILAGWARQHRRARTVQVVPGSPEQAFLLAGFGLELVEEEALLPPLPPSLASAAGTGPAPGGDPEPAEPTGRVAGAGHAACP